MRGGAQSAPPRFFFFMKLFRFAVIPFLALACACGETPVDEPQDNKEPEEQHVATPVPEFAKGVDIGWVTEMEKKGYKFYTESGSKKECTALMRDLGANAVRYRVWVNPSDGWCSKEDVLEKALRAQRLGMAVMIDFHYSDTWADPGKQYTPKAWETMSVNDMSTALANHTKEVLNLLKENEIDVAWVQVGNETRTGMCWPTGKISTGNATNFAILANAGYSAVKEVYPDAIVLLHHDVANDLGRCKWFFDEVTKAGVEFDMIGLSLYPSYWDNSLNAYPDWTTKTTAAVSNFKSLHDAYGKPVMLVEFGMPATEVDKAKAAFKYVLDGVASWDWFKGVFYWEPESEKSRNGYDYGAFSGGKSTGVIDLYKH